MSMWWARVVNTIPGDCLASSAIRCCRVEMESELNLSGIFPSNGSVSRRRFPSTGSLGSVPPLRRYSAALRLLSARPGSLRSSLAARYPSPTAPFRSSGRRSRKAAPRPGPFVRWTHPRHQRETERSPRFLGNPWQRAPLSDPDEGNSPRSISWRLLWPSGDLTPSALAACQISGLHHAARCLAVYASQAGSPHTHARLATGWPELALPGRTFTRGVPKRVSRGHRLHLHSLAPSFSWRTRTPDVHFAESWSGAGPKASTGS